LYQTCSIQGYTFKKIKTYMRLKAKSAGPSRTVEKTGALNVLSRSFCFLADTGDGNE